MSEVEKKEIFSLNIFRLDSNNEVQIHCMENCGDLAQYLIEKKGKKIYLCKEGFLKLLLEKKVVLSGEEIMGMSNTVTEIIGLLWELDSQLKLILYNNKD